MTAQTSLKSGDSVSNMAVYHARLKDAPPKHTREACAEGMEQMVGVKQRIAHQMLSRKVAIARRTAEGMGTAVSQVVTRRVFEGRPSAPSTVRTGSAQRTGVKPTQRQVERSVRSIPLTK